MAESRSNRIQLGLRVDRKVSALREVHVDVRRQGKGLITHTLKSEGVRQTVIRTAKNYSSLIALLPVFLAGQLTHANEEPLRVTFYGGALSTAEIGSSLDFEKIDDSFQFLSLGVNRKLGSLFDNIGVELEGQITQHFGEQHHTEIGGLFLLRSNKFPWSNRLATTFAMGEGLSYASQTSELEAKLHDKTSKFLNFMVWELEFSLPKSPNISYFGRVHHRSGIFGLFNGVHAGSNGLGIGVRFSI
jgi:hypothetical protein